MDEPTAMVHGLRDTNGFWFDFRVTEEQAQALYDAPVPSGVFTLHGPNAHAYFNNEGVFCYGISSEGPDRLKTAYVDGDLVRSALGDMIDLHRIEPVWIS